MQILDVSFITAFMTNYLQIINHSTKSKALSINTKHKKDPNRFLSKIAAIKRVVSIQKGGNMLTAIVMTSAVLSLLSSSSIELSDEKDKVRFLDRTIGSRSSCDKKMYF